MPEECRTENDSSCKNFGKCDPKKVITSAFVVVDRLPFGNIENKRKYVAESCAKVQIQHSLTSLFYNHHVKKLLTYRALMTMFRVQNEQEDKPENLIFMHITELHKNRFCYAKILN